MLVTRNRDFLASHAVRKAETPVSIPKRLSLWTDDFNNLLRILK
jgi:hypothetical protein